MISTIGATTAVAAISARALRKSFGEKTVLDGIDLTSRRARSWPCSARTGRKTTAVHLLTTYLRPDAGRSASPARIPPRTRRRSGARSA